MTWCLFGTDVTSFSHKKTEVHKLQHWNPLYPCFTGGDPPFTGKAWWGQALRQLRNQNNQGKSSLGRYYSVNSDRIPGFVMVYICPLSPFVFVPHIKNWVFSVTTLSLSPVASLKDIIYSVDVLEKVSSASGCTGKSVHYSALYLACVPTAPVAPRASAHPADMA